MLDKILKLPGLLIKNSQHLDNIGWIFKVESTQKSAICPPCEISSKKLHQNHFHLVKDLPICGQDTYLNINRRQWKCDQCFRPFSDELIWVKKRRDYTKRLADHILEQLKKSNIKNVIEMNNVTEAEVERMLKDIQEEINNPEIKNLKKLGIDKISLIKGKHKYCAVLINLETRTPLRILEKRTQEAIEAELMTWGE